MFVLIIDSDEKYDVIPVGATHFVVHSRRGELLGNAVVSNAIVDAYVGSVVVTIDPFFDNDKGPGIDGVLTWSTIENDDDIDGYKIYYGAEDRSKIGGAVGSVPKTERTLQLSSANSIANVLIYAYRGYTHI